MATLSAFKSTKYILNSPVEITIKQKNKIFYASYEEAHVFSNGKTEDDAIARLEKVFILMYEKLNCMPMKNLSPALLKYRNKLNELITKVATPSAQ